MKREEKNQLMRERIMDSALAEFSSQGYAGSSINTICAAQGLSKGVVYHYFKNKDALFLACVEACFQQLTAYLRAEVEQAQGDAAQQLTAYFSARMRFFNDNPVYQSIFCAAVIAPPAQLHDQILESRRQFDELNIQMFDRLLSTVRLRPSIRRKEVIETFRQFQDFINIHCDLSGTGPTNFADREEACRKTLDILLYGIIERNPTYHEKADEHCPVQ